MMTGICVKSRDVVNGLQGVRICLALKGQALVTVGALGIFRMRKAVFEPLMFSMTISTALALYSGGMMSGAGMAGEAVLVARHGHARQTEPAAGVINGGEGYVARGVGDRRFRAPSNRHKGNS